MKDYCLTTHTQYIYLISIFMITYIPTSTWVYIYIYIYTHTHTPAY